MAGVGAFEGLTLRLGEVCFSSWNHLFLLCDTTSSISQIRDWQASLKDFIRVPAMFATNLVYSVSNQEGYLSFISFAFSYYLAVL